MKCALCGKVRFLENGICDNHLTDLASDEVTDEGKNVSRPYGLWEDAYSPYSKNNPPE